MGKTSHPPLILRANIYLTLHTLFFIRKECGMHRPSKIEELVSFTISDELTFKLLQAISRLNIQRHLSI